MLLFCGRRGALPPQTLVCIEWIKGCGREREACRRQKFNVERLASLKQIVIACSGNKPTGPDNKQAYQKYCKIQNMWVVGKTNFLGIYCIERSRDWQGCVRKGPFSHFFGTEKVGKLPFLAALPVCAPLHT